MATTTRKGAGYLASDIVRGGGSRHRDDPHVFFTAIGIATSTLRLGQGKKMNVVVVAEDEPLVLIAIVDHLIHEGFHVLEARHADEALAILTRDAAVVRLLFTDVQMPGEMNGVELSHHVKTHWPWIGLLVTSGHLDPAVAELPEGCRFLRKPYHHDHVVTHLRELASAA